MLGLVLQQVVTRGTLTVIWPNGSTSSYGNGAPRATVRIHGRWSAWTIGFKPDLALGEAYMDGRMTVEDGTIADVLEILISSVGAGRLPLLVRLERALDRKSVV